MDSRIRDVKDGDQISMKLLVFQVNKGFTNKGNAYLSLQLQDASGSLDGKLWNVTQEQIELYKAGMICMVKGSVLSHNGQLQIKVVQMDVLDKNKEDLTLFVKSSGIGKEELKFKINRAIEEIQNDSYKKLVKSVLLEYEDDFYVYPAASKNHHNFVGGLATHVLGMIEVGSFLAKQYPLLDYDLLLSGIVLHDIGKVVELSGSVVVEYTLEGKLLGHISIMQAKLYEIARRLNIDNEELVLLRHMILSHHGKMEYGSPVLPLLPEAEMLNFIDNIDARMNTIEKAFDHVEPGNFTPRIFAMENRAFYKAKDKE